MTTAVCRGEHWVKRSFDDIEREGKIGLVGFCFREYIWSVKLNPHYLKRKKQTPRMAHSRGGVSHSVGVDLEGFGL